MNALTVLHLTECNDQYSTKPQDLKFLYSMKSSMYLNQALIINSKFLLQDSHSVSVCFCPCPSKQRTTSLAEQLGLVVGSIS